MYSSWSDTPSDLSDQSSGINTTTTSSKTITSASNGNSNAGISGVSSSTNYDDGDNDSGFILTNEVTNDDVHDEANINSERSDRSQTCSVDTTTHADDFQTLVIDSEDHVNNEEDTNEYHRNTDNENTGTMDTPRRTNRRAGKRPDVNFEDTCLGIIKTTSAEHDNVLSLYETGIPFAAACADESNNVAKITLASYEQQHCGSTSLFNKVFDPSAPTRK